MECLPARNADWAISIYCKRFLLVDSVCGGINLPLPPQNVFLTSTAKHRVCDIHPPSHALWNPSPKTAIWIHLYCFSIITWSSSLDTKRIFWIIYDCENCIFCSSTSNIIRNFIRVYIALRWPMSALLASEHHIKAISISWLLEWQALK